MDAIITVALTLSDKVWIIVTFVREADVSYEVEVWSEDKIIFVKNVGLYSAEDAIEQVSALLKLAEEHKIYNRSRVRSGDL